MSVSRGTGGGVLRNENYTWYGRNMDSTASDNQATYPNNLENTGLDPISPPRGHEWDIHLIEWNFFVRQEDDSDANLSESLSAYGCISEDDTPNVRLEGGGEMDTFDYQIRDDGDPAFNADSFHDDSVWTAMFTEVVVNMHNNVDGLAGGGSNFWGPFTEFKPPEPVTISDRVNLDFHLVIMNPFATSVSGDTSHIAGFTATVWYTEREVEDTSAR